MLERLRSNEAWFTACERMGKEELLDLVEHVHGKIVDERRRRKEAEVELLAAQSPGVSARDANPKR